MIASEFGMIQQKLHGAFSILSDKPDQQVWFDALKAYDYSDVDAAVTEFIYSNNRRPTIADIADGARRNKAIRTQPIDFRNTKTVKCPYCNDTGLIVTETPLGVKNGTPCDHCGLGRVKHPWYYKTEEEKEEYIKDEERRGLRPPRKIYEASKEFYMMYNYGIKV